MELDESPRPLEVAAILGISFALIIFGGDGFCRAHPRIYQDACLQLGVEARSLAGAIDAEVRGSAPWFKAEDFSMQRLRATLDAEGDSIVRSLVEERRFQQRRGQRPSGRLDGSLAALR